MVAGLAKKQHKMNQFETFLQRISSKIGAKNAFDLSRDARAGALTKLLIKKGILSQEEINNSESEEFNMIANNIANMPPLPMETKIAR